MKFLRSQFLLFCLISVVSYAQTSTLTLEDIWKSPKFTSRLVSGLNSMQNGEYYTTLVSSGKKCYILKYAYASGELKDTLFKSEWIKTSNGESPLVDDYSFSLDESQLIISTEKESIYRYSTASVNYIFNLKTHKSELLSKNGKQRLAGFSPDGKYVSWVENNNLFIKAISTGVITQVTKDGIKNKIINGACDWVYEEEFGFDKAYEWSPDAQYILIYRFDETLVKEYSMPVYGDLYPQNETFKYPKAGESNSIVNLLLFKITDGKLSLVDTGKNSDQYIPRIKWTSKSGYFSFIVLNRLQNKLELRMGNALDGSQKLLLTEECRTYIDITDDLIFLDGNSFLWTSEKDGYRHIYLYNSEGQLIRQLTSGKWDVEEIKGVSRNAEEVFFTASPEGPNQKAICKASLNGKMWKIISKEKGTNKPVFNSNCTYYINTYSNSYTPPLVSLHDQEGKLIRVLESNQNLNETLKKYSLAQKEFIDIPLTNGIVLKGWIMKPVNFQPNKKYPLYMYVYGGPGKNTVCDAWEGKEFMWHQFLTQEGYVVVSVDNRGTQFRGEEFKKCTYGDLGNLETQDQIDAARYFSGMSFIDPARIGIQGWSFGGYLSALCITKGADIFKAAISVAPVTDWRYYDSVYSERFLGLPSDNLRGYKENSPVNFAQQLKGSFLLVHGTADDNVHFQNTVELVRSLQNADKDFELMIYPDKNHGISGGNSRLHLYKKMFDFLQRKL